MVDELSRSFMARTGQFAIAALLLATGPAAADGMLGGARLAVGDTRINCVKAPCPWRGIVEIDNPARDPLRPLWSGDKLPPMRASAADTALLGETWAGHGCLLVDGRFDGRILHVAHVLGPCP